MTSTKSQAIAGTLASAWIGFWHEWHEGLQLVKQERRVLGMFSLMAITSLGEGVFSVLFIVFVSQVLHGGVLELSWLMAAQAIGGLIGGVLIGHVIKGVHLSHLIGYSAIVFGAVDLLIFNYPRFIGGVVPGLLLFICAGIVGVGIFTGANTLLQNVVPDRYRGRVFGAIGTTSAILMLLGTALAGLLGNPRNVITVLNIQGSMYILAGAFVLFILRVSRERVIQDSRREKWSILPDKV
jgi:MFS family permease